VTVIGIDDTDSRQRGMCTTYLAADLAARIERMDGTVDRTVLVRLNPAVEYKTRGNAALAVHCDLPAEQALDLAAPQLDRAETDDERTNPGLVVAPGGPAALPESVVEFASAAIHAHLDLSTARERTREGGFLTATRGNGRGLIGALAAVGAWQAFDEWTYEMLSYREQQRWGTERDVDRDSVFAAASEAYPEVWDTVDTEEGTAVCVPRTPCPVLHGIRGDDPDAVRRVAAGIESEPVARRQMFVTNQGTDAHLQDGRLGALAENTAYRVDARVASQPETREGGHVFCRLESGDESVDAAAFEPTKRFRDRVRALRPGDEITACGEVSEGTLKLEKFAVRELVETEQRTPDCPSCERSMKSAGRNAGYRCRDCGTHADGLVAKQISRELSEGWYEVPPYARRHIAKPLVRGGFDAPTHPDR
jgi:tRNA(Ile2)-agmatinylcytidine synthase